MTAPGIVVLGDLVTDVVAQLSQPLAPGSDATAVIRMTGGGSGANVAAWLAAAGIAAAFVGRIGDDALGRLRARELEDAGVVVSVASDAEAPTGTVVVLVADDGSRTMVPDRGANRHLRAADVAAGLLAAGRHLHLSGYVLLDPASRAAGLAVLHRAREAGMTISVDPSSVQPLHTAGVEQWLTDTAGADLCLPNLDEAEAMTGTRDVAKALATLTSTYAEVVVTLGPEGAAWSDGTQVIRAPAEPAGVSDTTGAGDAFTAGFLGARAAGAGPSDALAAGARLAAAAVAVPGARPPA